MRVHLDLTSRQKTSFKFSLVNMQRHLTLLRKLMLPSCQGECSVFEDVEVLFSFNCSGESSDTLATHVFSYSLCSEFQLRKVEI